MADLVTQTRAYWRNRNMTFRDDQHSGTRGVSLWETAPTLAQLGDPNLANVLFDDFYHFDGTAAVGNWAVVADVGGSQAVADGANGVVNIKSDGDDNDEAYASSPGEAFLFDADRPLWFEARVQCLELAAAANLIVGISDTVGADALLDDGGGPAASYDGAVFFKVDAGTVWQFETSNAGTQVTNTNVGAYAADTFYRLGFTYNPSGGTTGVITPYFDGVAGTAQDITISGLQEMHAVLGVKTGSAAEETLQVDYIKIMQIRA